MSDRRFKLISLEYHALLMRKCIAWEFWKKSSGKDYDWLDLGPEIIPQTISMVRGMGYSFFFFFEMQTRFITMNITKYFLK